MAVTNIVTRLDTIAALDGIFTRAGTGSDQGAWVQTGANHSGSTPSGNTGPGSNSAGSYVYSETSGSAPLATITANSTLTVKSDVMTAWTGTDRTLRFRAAIMGYAWTENGEGFEIQGRVSASDSWARIELIRGWSYSDTYATGNTIDRGDAGTDDDLTCAQNGGWVDFDVTIPDDHTEVRLRSLPMPGPGSSHQHDLALWDIELRNGMPPPPSAAITTPEQTVEAGAQVNLTADTSGGGLTYAWTGSGRFADSSAEDTAWTAPSPSTQTEFTLTLTVTDSSNRTAEDTVMITVEPVPVVNQAEILPPLTASIDGAAHWPGGLSAEVERYSASISGGPDSATLNVEGPETGLRWLLSQLRRPLQLWGRQAGTVWWGFVDRVELRLGAVNVSASLDGLRTAIAVTYPQNGADNSPSARSEFHLAQPLAQQYGRIEALDTADTANNPSPDALADLLTPHLKIARTAQDSAQPASGARLYARGWSATLAWRYAPRHSNSARFGNVSLQNAELARPAIGTHSSPVEWAAWCDFGPHGHPGFDLYLDSARLMFTGPVENAALPAGYSDNWTAGVRIRAGSASNDPNSFDPPTDRIGSETAFNASDLPRVLQNPPYNIAQSKNPSLVEFDFSSQNILLPDTGFFLTLMGMLTHQFQYVRTDPSARIWQNDDPHAAWSWGRNSGGSWTQSSDSTKRPVYDFSVRANASGLLRMLLEEHDILLAGPAPEQPGSDTYTLYLDGTETVAQRLVEVQQTERLAYLVDPARNLHFFHSGQSVWRLARNGQWQTRVAHGAMPFLGQFVRSAGGDTALCESATFTPRSGLWELGFRNA